MLKNSSRVTTPSLSTLLASNIISLSSSSLMFSPSSLAMFLRSSNSIQSLFLLKRMNAFASSYSESRSLILVVMTSRKSLKSIVTWPSLSLSRSMSLPLLLLFKSLIRVLISSFYGSKPRARRATLSSFTSIMPEPLVSKRSKASFTSAFWASVSSCLYPLVFAFFFPGPDPLAPPSVIFAGSPGTSLTFVFVYF